MPVGSSLQAYPYGSGGYNSYSTPSYSTPSYSTPSYSTPSYKTPSYMNPTIIRQTGPNTYSGVGNNNTFRGAGGGIQPKLGTSNPSGGWVWNNNKGTLHKCTALGICTD